MSHLIASDEQARLIAEASSPVPIRDQSGNLIGYVSPASEDEKQNHSFTPGQIAEAKRRSKVGGACYTTQEVVESLSSRELQ